jgi:hypothetical protein
MEEYTHFLDDKLKAALILMILIAYIELYPKHSYGGSFSILYMLSRLVIFFFAAYICTRDVAMSLLYAVVLIVALWVSGSLLSAEYMTVDLEENNNKQDSESEPLYVYDPVPEQKPEKRKVHFANPVVDNIGSGYRNSEFANADHSNNDVSLNYSNLMDDYSGDSV